MPLGLLLHVVDGLTNKISNLQPHLDYLLRNLSARGNSEAFQIKKDTMIDTGCPTKKLNFRILTFMCFNIVHNLY